jgi:hypothetical protein
MEIFVTGFMEPYFSYKKTFFKIDRKRKTINYQKLLGSRPFSLIHNFIVLLLSLFSIFIWKWYHSCFIKFISLANEIEYLSSRVYSSKRVPKHVIENSLNRNLIISEPSLHIWIFIIFKIWPRRDKIAGHFSSYFLPYKKNIPFSHKIYA